MLTIKPDDVLSSEFISIVYILYKSDWRFRHLYSKVSRLVEITSQSLRTDLHYLQVEKKSVLYLRNCTKSWGRVYEERITLKPDNP